MKSDMPSDRMKKIEILKYKPNWALLFEVEVKEIKAVSMGITHFIFIRFPPLLKH
jgi:hypothetical protein